jgi:hypothetical protein
MASGLETDSNGGKNGRGSNALEPSNAAGATAMTHAHHRQRGEGNDPVGVSSSTKEMHTRPTSVALSAYTATWRAAGKPSGLATAP